MGDRGKYRTRDKAVPFQSAQCQRQHALRDAGNRAPQFAEPLRALPKHGNHEHAPLIAHALENLTYGTALLGHIQVTGDMDVRSCLCLTGNYLASVSDDNWMGPNMRDVNVAVIVGSNRRDSINRKLARALVKMADGKLTASFIQIDDLPMYSQDMENPLPASVSCFKAELERADALLFVTPEHNRSLPAVLKNAVDWGTRPYGRNSWAGKPAAIIGASPGAIGSALAQQHLRQVMGDLGALVMGEEAYMAFGPELIDATDSVTDAGTAKFLQCFVERFAALAARLAEGKTNARAA